MFSAMWSPFGEPAAFRVPSIKLESAQHDRDDSAKSIASSQYQGQGVRRMRFIGSLI
jgi:hypothetical protein